MNAKKQIKQILKSISDEDAEKLLKLISENIEVVATEYDKKMFERARKEIENGEYEFI
ncbi:hypothetical protein [Desulfosporosinus youngiae]|uniref:Uncharacterized protein n=1 Tax=Desulfosporosinus youngiae DSM 17734 TaxID=768710 RepID=H5Y597_9FIRM|nr:hypothetical protein [Desulfosporosinus youngiae]EHQ90201.1 hypothetical protein DesyoDRAFT_3167 [Desulfosporosinus youngiae DSM 17734]